MLKLLFDRDRIYLYPYQFADESLTADMKDVFGRGIEGPIYSEFRQGHRYEYCTGEEVNELGKFFFEKILDESDFPQSVIENTFRLGDELLEFCETLAERDLKSLSAEELADLYDEYAGKIRVMRAWGWIPPLVDGIEVPYMTDHAQEALRGLLRERSREEKFNDIFSVLSSSEEESEVRIEERNRLELFRNIVEGDGELRARLSELSSDAFLAWTEENRQEAAERIRNHAAEFEWLPYAYEGPGMIPEDVVTLLRETLESGIDPTAALDEMETRPKLLKERKAEVIRELDISDELQYLFRVLTMFMTFKDHRKGLYQRSYVKMDPVLEEIGRRVRLDLKEVKYLTRKEVREALGGKDFKSICSDRTTYCMARTRDGETEFLDTAEIEKVKSELKTDEVGDVSELTGQIAYPGVARGTAKVVIVREDVEKVEEGNIIVSSSTNPDLISAMQKASAFVTDMGGVICHAAIVAREMKKPCIVGTKHATKVLRDGDDIEVDANQGVVRILKRSG